MSSVYHQPQINRATLTQEFPLGLVAVTREHNNDVGIRLLPPRKYVSACFQLVKSAYVATLLSP